MQTLVIPLMSLHTVSLILLWGSIIEKYTKWSTGLNFMNNKLSVNESVSTQCVISMTSLWVHRKHGVCNFNEVSCWNFPNPPSFFSSFNTAYLQECTAARSPKIAARFLVSTQVVHESDRGGQLKLVPRLGSEVYFPQVFPRRYAMGSCLTFHTPKLGSLFFNSGSENLWQLNCRLVSKPS